MRSRCLHAGGLVAFPTETVYGLGCDAESPEALRHLYAVKRRPAAHPVIVHVAGAVALDVYAVGVPDAARRLVAELWPGPLTVVVRRSGRIPDEVTGGRDTVGLRVPDEPTALALLRAFDGAVAAPSANRFGRVSPTTAADVRSDLVDEVDLVLDGGPCRIGVESTIVDCSGDVPAILRVGGVPQAVVERVLGAPVELRTAGEVAAPGTLTGHYAPRARVVLVDERAAGARAAGLLAAGERVGLLMLAPVPSGLPGGLVVLDPPADVDDFAAHALRAAARRRSCRARRHARGPTTGGRGGRGGRRPVDARRGGERLVTDRGVRSPIGVFDSGLGGLTVLRSLIDLVPDEPIVYFGDTGRFPYGPKPPDEVLGYSVEIGELLVERGARLVVVACNSAAAAALDHLQERLPVPVLGVIEPGVRSAWRATRNGRVGVIGTVGTVASGAYQRAARDLAGDVEITCVACPGFVEFVEAGDVDSEQVHVLAERLLAPVRDAGVDTLVLGCTHYPLLARTIGDVMGREVVLVSSADETAFAVRELLGVERSGSGGVGAGPAPRRFLTSGDVSTFRELGARFLGPEVDDVEAWSWS